MEKGRWRQDPLLGENSREGNLRTLGTGLPRESAMKKFTVRDRSRPERHACFRGGLTIGVHKIPIFRVVGGDLAQSLRFIAENSEY
jgi:hypothetical protein